MKNNVNSSIPIARQLITTVVKKGTQFSEAISQVLKEEKVTLQQFNALRILRGRKGEPANLRDVSKDMLHSNSNTTRVVDKLVAKKYAKRTQSPNDRRQIELLITQTGLDLLSRLDDKVDKKEEELVLHLSNTEMQQVMEILMNCSNQSM